MQGSIIKVCAEEETLQKKHNKSGFKDAHLLSKKQRICYTATCNVFANGWLDGAGRRRLLKNKGHTS